MMSENPSKIGYEIIQTIGVLSESGIWKKELNIVQWGDNIAKYDIRTWNADHTKAGKGVTLSVEELKSLRDLINSIEL